MRTRTIATGAGVATGLILVAAAAFVVGRRWPISRLEAVMAKLRPSATAEALLPWRVAAMLPEFRYENGRALIGDELYFFGGFYNEATQASRRVDILNLQTLQWRTGREMPEAVTHGNAVVVGDSVVWFVGGFVGDHPGPTTAHTWRYHVREDEWRPGPALPAERGGGGLALLGDTLHYFGGWLPDRNTDAPEHWRLIPGDTTWEPRAPMPLPRGHLAAVSLPGAFFALGGNHGHDPAPLDVAAVHRYDPAMDRWTEEAALAQPRSHAEPGAMVWRDRVLLVGGRNVPGVELNIANVISWHPGVGRSRYEAPLPVPLLAPTAVVAHDTLFVGAGAPRGNNPTNATIWKLPLVGAWLPFPPMPIPLGEVSGVVMHDRLFLVGEGGRHTLGLDLRTGEWDRVTQWSARPMPGDHHAAEVLNDEWLLIGGLGNPYVGTLVQRFDPARNAWQLGPSLPIPLGSSASAVIHDRLFLVGGISEGRTVAEGFVLDAPTGSWRPIAPMPLPRNHAASATDGERLWVFGGRGPGSGDSNMVANGFADVQVYDPRTDRWTVSDGSSEAPVAMPQARGGMGKALFLDGEFWVIGGETADGAGANSAGVYDRVDIYNPSTRRWRAGPPLRHARHGIFPVVDDGRILVAGGGIRAAGSVSDVVEVLRPR